MEPRHTRYQAAIVRGDEILIIAHREHSTNRQYWLLPGGGIEPGETEEACVLREVHEETGLQVRIERMLLDEERLPGSGYRKYKTYLCHFVSGEPAPGYEPEEYASSRYAISAVRWLDLRFPLGWGSDVIADPWTYPLLLRVRDCLGY